MKLPEKSQKHNILKKITCKIMLQNLVQNLTEIYGYDEFFDM